MKYRIVETRFYSQDFTYEVEADSERAAVILVKAGNEHLTYTGDLIDQEDSDISESQEISNG